MPAVRLNYFFLSLNKIFLSNHRLCRKNVLYTRTSLATQPAVAELVESNECLEIMKRIKY